MSDLLSARNKINRIDEEMIKLFEERMDAVFEVANYKREVGLPIEDTTRENLIIAENTKKVKNPDYRPYYNDFLKNNISISKAYQKRIVSGASIAVNGSLGAFADITASKVFSGASIEPFSDFTDAYNAASDGKCDYAFLPLENSFGGDVGAVLDLAFFGDLYINGIFEAEIVQNLLAKKDTDIKNIKTVLSHPQALLQCASFIKEYKFETEETANTAIAAKKVFESNDNTVASIGSKELAKRFDLKILKEHINESNSNTTRFAVFSRSRKEPSDNDNRFILTFTVKNTAGALSKAISVIGEYRFNLLTLKSRPNKISNWNYYFYVEGEGNINSENGKNMIHSLKACCEDLKIVGSYEKEVKVKSV